MSPPCPRTFGRPGQGCWVSSTWTSSQWVRRTRLVISAMLSRHGGAMTAVRPRWRPADRRADRRRRSRRGFALRRLEPTLADRFVSLQLLSALAVSNRLMVAAPAGASWHLPAPWIKLVPWPVTCAIVQSCWRRWLVLIQRIRPRSIYQSPHGKLA